MLDAGYHRCISGNSGNEARICENLRNLWITFLPFYPLRQRRPSESRERWSCDAFDRMADRARETDFIHRFRRFTQISFSEARSFRLTRILFEGRPWFAFGTGRGPAQETLRPLR